MSVGLRVQAGSRLIQEEDARVPDEFDADADSLALAAAKIAHDVVAFLLKPEFDDDLVDSCLHLVQRRVGRHAQLRGEEQRLFDGKVWMDDIVLGYIAQARAEDT